MIHSLVTALSSLDTAQSVMFIILGALIGMVFGAVPGISTAVLLSIMLVFVNHLSLIGTLCLFLGAQSGSYFSASITSILLNTPAHPEAFAVTFDGFPMAQRGEAGRALGISATSTCFGGFIGCAVLVACIPLLNYLPTFLHPPDYVALVLLAMFLVGTLGTDSVAKAAASAGIGLALSTIGASSITGQLRFTFGSVGLYTGLSLVALALGLFALPQMVMVFGTGTVFASQDLTGHEIGVPTPVELTKGFGRQVVAGLLETFRHWALLVQSGLVGAVTGIVPGVGGFAANFMSYGIAKQTSRKSELFGTGIPEGIIAPEGSSLAKEAGHMIPLIGIGIPGGVAGALFIAALTLKGVRTGYGFSSAFPIVPYQIAWIIALTGLVGTAAGLLLAPQLARVTRVPGALLVPFIFSFAILGPFLADTTFFACVEVLVFGLVGLALRRLRFSLASCILGLVLGPTLESNIYLTHSTYPGVSFLQARPLADGLLALIVLLFVMKVRQTRRERARAAAELATELDQLDGADARAAAIRNRHQKDAPYPVFMVIVSTLLIAFGAYFVIFAWMHYNFRSAVLPIFSGFLIAVPLVYLYPSQVQHLLRYRSDRFASIEAQGAASGSSAANDRGEPRELIQASAGGATSLTALLQSSSGALAPIEQKSWGPNGQYRREMALLAWFGFLVLLCWLVGFEWGIPIFTASYSLTCLRRFLSTNLRRLAFAAFTSVVMGSVTYELLNVTHLVFHPVIGF